MFLAGLIEVQSIRKNEDARNKLGIKSMEFWTLQYIEMQARRIVYIQEQQDHITSLTHTFRFKDPNLILMDLANPFHLVYDSKNQLNSDFLGYFQELGRTNFLKLPLLHLLPSSSPFSLISLHIGVSYVHLSWPNQYSSYTRILYYYLLMCSIVHL